MKEQRQGVGRCAHQALPVPWVLRRGPVPPLTLASHWCASHKKSHRLSLRGQHKCSAGRAAAGVAAGRHAACRRSRSADARGERQYGPLAGRPVENLRAVLDCVVPGSHAHVHIRMHARCLRLCAGCAGAAAVVDAHSCAVDVWLGAGGLCSPSCAATTAPGTGRKHTVTSSPKLAHSEEGACMASGVLHFASPAEKLAITPKPYASPTLGRTPNRKVRLASGHVRRVQRREGESCIPP